MSETTIYNTHNLRVYHNGSMFVTEIYSDSAQTSFCVGCGNHVSKINHDLETLRTVATRAVNGLNWEDITGVGSLLNNLFEVSKIVSLQNKRKKIKI